jgi:transposase
VADEAFRDLIRCIEDLRGDLMRARHRLSKFLLRRGHRYQDGHAWTPKHGRWLRTLSFEGVRASDIRRLLRLGRAARRTPSDAARDARADRSQLLARPDDRPLALLPRDRDAHRAGLCAETGGFHRFPRPTMLSGFLGIVPSERTSDQKRRQGSITKAGSPHARRLLVEAAHHYRKQPAISQTLAHRQAGQDPRVIEIAWHAQRRLHQRWAHPHTERRKPAGVVAIAVARELAAFLWEAATLDA